MYSSCRNICVIINIKFLFSSLNFTPNTGYAIILQSIVEKDHDTIVKNID